MGTRHGGKILVDQLAIQGCEAVFLVPGESYLAALDGLADHPEIKTIICRQEGGAAMMAEAYGKMTGRPGVAMVTRGPGATNASPGVHIARQDSTPMVMLVGQVGRDAIDREAFQEINYREMFAPIAKWVGQIEQTERIPEYVSHAYHRAASGRPGPVVIAAPEDVLSGEADVPDAPHANPGVPKANPAELAHFGEILAGAERPFLMVGGPGWTAEARANVMAFAQRLSLPVAAAFRSQDRFDNDHPSYVGEFGIGANPALLEMLEKSDVLIAIGPRLGELTTAGYATVDIPVPRQKLVHVHPGAEELGYVYHPTLSINASMDSFAAGLKDVGGNDDSRWARRTRAAHDAYLAWTEPEATVGDVRMENVMCHVREALPADTIICNGAGNYTAWVHRYNRYRSHTSSMAPTSGSMGYGLPAAIAAKLAAPHREVVCFAGDGCFMMTGQEFATAVQYELPITVVVVNNGMFGTIRMHQERNYPDRISGTSLVNPDFAALARCYGAYGAVVERDEDFAAALDEARASGGPAIIELRMDPEALTPRATLSEVRAAGKTAQQN